MITFPRRLFLYPIFLTAIVQQYISCVSLLVNPDAHYATGLHILYLIFTPALLPIVLFLVPTFSWLGFFAHRKATTLLCLIPQQLLLYMSAGGSFEAVVIGHYADGVPRSHAFILADQSLVMLLAMFHTWAIILTMRYGEDPNGV